MAISGMIGPALQLAARARGAQMQGQVQGGMARHELAREDLLDQMKAALEGAQAGEMTSRGHMYEGLNDERLQAAKERAQATRDAAESRKQATLGSATTRKEGTLGAAQSRKEATVYGADRRAGGPDTPAQPKASDRLNYVRNRMKDSTKPSFDKDYKLQSMSQADALKRANDEFDLMMAGGKPVTGATGNAGAAVGSGAGAGTATPKAAPAAAAPRSTGAGPAGLDVTPAAGATPGTKPTSSTGYVPPQSPMEHWQDAVAWAQKTGQPIPPPPSEGMA